MAKNRYIGEYPAIGIRPIVDGRRGPMKLRESPEDQVMAMANAAKKLFEENLCYSNGEPVRVVMADSSIGRVPETAACADKFKRENVAVTLSVTPCWCYGAETMDMDPQTINVVQPGTPLGNLTEEVAKTVDYRCKVVLPASHDTASAILAMPSARPDTAYISSGTWSLLGVELESPDCGEERRETNFTNEGGFDESICYLKNIMGLWVIQSVKKELASRGIELSFGQLCDLAEASCMESIVSCNDDRFLAPASMIREIQSACRETSQPIPETPGEIARVVYRSLAKCYGEAIEQLRKSRKVDYRTLSILGGGSNAEFLNRLTAQETGCTVYAGPGEATAIGNALAQMVSFGECSNIDYARQIVNSSFNIKMLAV